jgi:hypothetical protein
MKESVSSSPNRHAIVDRAAHATERIAWHVEFASVGWSPRDEGREGTIREEWLWRSHRERRRQKRKLWMELQQQWQSQWSVDALPSWSESVAFVCRCASSRVSPHRRVCPSAAHERVQNQRHHPPRHRRSRSRVEDTRDRRCRRSRKCIGRRLEDEASHLQADSASRGHTRDSIESATRSRAYQAQWQMSRSRDLRIQRSSMNRSNN